MTYFDEHGEYWGNLTEPLLGSDARLTARSVKIFADGRRSDILIYKVLDHSRRPENGRSSRKLLGLVALA